MESFATQFCDMIKLSTQALVGTRLLYVKIYEPIKVLPLRGEMYQNCIKYVRARASVSGKGSRSHAYRGSCMG